MCSEVGKYVKIYLQFIIVGEYMSKINEIYEALEILEKKNKKYISAFDLSEYLKMDRANISRYLNQLYRNKKIEKIEGRPVVYHCIKQQEEYKNSKVQDTLDKIIGASSSLKVPIQQAKAAILYPPKGLHSLILGETGVGKSMFAELMYEFSKEAKVINDKAPFIRFNCADYADNPQLLVAQIFGVKKGAYTGAEKDKQGLLKKADGGILFLDEIHRLSPQGQEMLFTYIDKGFFRPLGDTEDLVKVQVQIIAATTENPESYLLKTFTRRIPMIIKLPSLKHRTLKERYLLLKEFITLESKRLGKNIYIDKNALCSFLLYDCPNNIGQLRSDIQLSCAKAFLDYKTKNLDCILIKQIDLPKNVNKGFMKIQQHREEIKNLLENKGDILIFYNDDYTQNLSMDEGESFDKEGYFYDFIEKKLAELKNQGMNEKEISDVLNIDMEAYFEKYIKYLPGKFPREEIKSVVGDKIVKVVDEILDIAQNKLNRELDEKIYCGLALHLQRSIERIREGSYIYHPKLNFIRVQYADEFMAAIEMAKAIDKNFSIETPLHEIGYLTMFLASDQYDNNVVEEKKVSILVIMHGKTTASSMAEVANELLGEECAEALDMPLSMKAEHMYEIAKNKVKKIDKGKGVLLLVDMGSLTNFGSMISEETGVDTRTIDMVSTALVIEACRKSSSGKNLEFIYNSCVEISRYGVQMKMKSSNYKKFLIITACFTGDGAAERLKDIIDSSLENNSNIDIVCLNILDKADFLCQVDGLSNKYKIIAVVGTVNIFIKDVPFISATQILTGEGIEELKNLISLEQNFYNIKNCIQTHVKIKDSDKLVDTIKEAIGYMEKALDIILPYDVKIGVILHISFMIDKLKNNGEETFFEGLDKYIARYNREFIVIGQCLKQLEKMYDICIGNSEKAYILKMFIQNSVTVQS